MARRNKGEERDLAISRIRRLLPLAEAAQRDGRSPKRYVELTQKIAMRYQLSLPAEIRRRICRSCGELLTPGRTARHRMTGRRLSVTCLSCGAVKRYPIRARRTIQ